MRTKRPILAMLAALALLLTISTASASAAGTRGAVYWLKLTGNQEATPTCAPPTVCGDPDAVASVALAVSPAKNTVCFIAAWSRIDGTVVAAHIHLGATGAPGPVVVPLFSGSFPGTALTAACVSANGQAAAIVANPSAYYVNIHSTVYPSGAVRDQLP